MEVYTILITKITDVSDLIKLTSKCPCEVLIKSGKYVVDGKSIMGVFSLDLSKPLTLEIHGTAPLDVRVGLVNFIENKVG